MRESTVPVDIVSEQKVVLGYVSIRQLIYLAVGAVVGYNWLKRFDLSSLDTLPMLITYSLLALPVIAFVYILGFYYRSKDDMYMDKFLLIKIRFLLRKKSTVYRHGNTLAESKFEIFNIHPQNKVKK